MLGKQENIRLAQLASRAPEVDKLSEGVIGQPGEDFFVIHVTLECWKEEGPPQLFDGVELARVLYY